MMFMTANEWYSRGYLIRRGARSEARNSRGIAMFSTYQVEPIYYRPRHLWIDARGVRHYA
jgi:hypothetical protein